MKQQQKSIRDNEEITIKNIPNKKDFKFKEVDPLQWNREKTAGIFAIILLFFTGIIFFTPIFEALILKDSKTQEYVKTILPVFTGILGIVVGFYFSEKRL